MVGCTNSCLIQLLELLRIQIKHKLSFFYYRFLIATNTQFLADAVLSFDSLNFKFGHVKNNHKGFCFSLSTEILTKVTL